MRETFHAQLDAVLGDLASAARLTGLMMTNASVALHHADLELAESVMSSKSELMALCDDIDQPDLQMVVSVMHAAGDLKRMGNLAQHIGKIARKRRPGVPIPGEIRPVFARMGVLATSLAQDAATAIECRDPVSADRLTQDDEEVDALRQRTLRIVFSKGLVARGGTAVDAALIGRYYERFADHAVAIARQASYFVTDLAPER